MIVEEIKMDRFILILKYIVIAFVQGVAEILPISSSGHMVITKHILGIGTEDLSFEIFLHFASLIAIVFFLRKRLFELVKDFLIFVFKRPNIEDANYSKIKNNFIICIYIVVATIPAGILGILLEDIIGQHLTSLLFVGIFLIITAILLYISTLIKCEKEIHEIKWYNALAIGLFQCVGILPGISRSGSCIVGSKAQKVNQNDSAEFAFLLAIPIMLGSAIFSINDISIAFQNKELIIPYIIAFIVTLFVTYVALAIFLKIVRKQKLYYFSIYCILMGILSIILYLLV